MGSHPYGKPAVCQWVRDHFPQDSTILDVGACDGIWRELLPEYRMDAVEIYKPNADRLRGYGLVFCCDIADYPFVWYDLIIFGDVIEHMPVEKAQQVLAWAAPRCRDMIVAVPFRYPQGEIYGNPWERHIQDDLTPELFAERYPGFEVLVDTGRNYCYYHKKVTDE